MNLEKYKQYNTENDGYLQKGKEGNVDIVPQTPIFVSLIQHCITNRTYSPKPLKDRTRSN